MPTQQAPDVAAPQSEASTGTQEQSSSLRPEDVTPDPAVNPPPYERIEKGFEGPAEKKK